MRRIRRFVRIRLTLLRNQYHVPPGDHKGRPYECGPGGRFVNQNYGVAVFPIARVGATLAVARVPLVGAVHERPANFAPCTAPAGDS